MSRLAKMVCFGLLLALGAGMPVAAQPNPPAKQEPDKTEEARSEPAFEIAKPTEPPISLEASLSLRDPFRRPALKAGDGKDEGGKVPELERYSVDEFKLVGVITGTRKNKAMLVTPDGKMHIVSESARIGLRHGVIRKIVPGKVDIEEKSVNILGEEEKSETTIELSEKGDDKEGRRL